jgi:hypothetical protein
MMSSKDAEELGGAAVQVEPGRGGGARAAGGGAQHRKKIAWKQDLLLPRTNLASSCATCRSSQTIFNRAMACVR